MSASAETVRPPQRQSLKHRLAERDIDFGILLLLPAVLVFAALFIYPFLYGLSISFEPETGGPFANYVSFFTDEFQRGTIFRTLRLAIPAALTAVVISAPIAYQARRDFRGRGIITLILLLPLTFGTILIAQGMTRVFSGSGWVNLALNGLGLPSGSFLYNYTGTFIATVLTTLPFAFLLQMGFFGGIDRSLESAAATLGASRAARFWRIILPLAAPGIITAFMLALVEAYGVFPSAILVGQPDNATHVLTLLIYQAASQRSDYSDASAIAVILTVSELIILGVLVTIRNRFYRGPATGGKG